MLKCNKEYFITFYVCIFKIDNYLIIKYYSIDKVVSMNEERAREGGEENLRRYGYIKRRMVFLTISNYNELSSKLYLQDSSLFKGVRQVFFIHCLWLKENDIPILLHTHQIVVSLQL